MITEITEQQKKDDVCRILKTQIICEKRKGKIRYDSESKVIYTGQTYCRTLDEDMSDFSIGFYKIIYSEILHHKDILKDGKLVDHCFVGDTINSFNSIANLVPQAGKTIKERTNRKVWPKWLQDYDNQYHCLANFWILPASLGRRGKKGNYYDSMDIFLEKLNDDYKILGKYGNYFKAFPEISDFNKTHQITRYSLNPNTLSMYKEKNAEGLVEQAQTMIDVRAEEISTSKYYKDLWDFFYENGLCGERT